MKKVDKIFVKVLATIAVILVALIVIYFVTVPNAFDGTWNHTYFLGSVLLFCVLGLIGFFIQKIKNLIGDTLGYGHCPNCNNTWYRERMTNGIKYKGDKSSSRGYLCVRIVLLIQRILTQTSLLKV